MLASGVAILILITCANVAGLMIAPAANHPREAAVRLATVSRMLTRLNKRSMIEPKPPPVRYEHAAPGDLLHIDIKKFARIVKAGHRRPAR